MNELDSLQELDTSWILDEESRYCRLQENCNLESISCYFVYIGSDKTIRKVIKESEILSSFNGNVGILNSRLLYLIQSKRYLENGQRYKMEKLVKYVLDIHSKQISDFSKLDQDGLKHYGSFLKEFSFLDNIIIESSPSMFHCFAGLYFFLREDSTIIQPVRSILKTGIVGRSTKKVRILEELNHEILNSVSNKKTKKVRD